MEQEQIEYSFKVPLHICKLSIEADNIQNGLGCIQAAIAQRIDGTFPPAPTPLNDIVVQQGEFVVVVCV